MTRSQKGRGGKEVSGRGERAEAREVERLILGPWVAFRAKSNRFFPRWRKPGTASRSVVIRKEASLHGSERQNKSCERWHEGISLSGRRVVELCDALVVIETSPKRMLTCACLSLSL